MPADEYQFTAMRLANLESALGVNPLDLLKAMVYEVESGNIKAETMVVVYTEPKVGENPGDVCRWRANLSRSQEVALLDCAHFGAMRNYMK